MNYKSDFHEKFQQKFFYEELISLSTISSNYYSKFECVFFFQFSFCLYTNI